MPRIEVYNDSGARVGGFNTNDYNISPDSVGDYDRISMNERVNALVRYAGLMNDKGPVDEISRIRMVLNDLVRLSHNRAVDISAQSAYSSTADRIQRFVLDGFGDE